MEKLSSILKKNYLLIIFLLLVVVTLFQLFARGRAVDQGHREEVQLAHVVRVIDGDTVELLSGEKVRYLGINTPEKGDPWSEIAWDRNRELVEGKDVKLVFDFEKRDHYNRLLAYVYQNDTFVNLQLVKEGLAWSFTVEPNDSYQIEFEMAESDAKQERIGLWSKLTVLVDCLISII
jgi:micrococcal nuclease